MTSGSRYQRKPSIRQAVWAGKDNASSRDVGESIRDVDRLVRDFVPCQKVTGVFTYAPPIALALKYVPSAIIVGQCRIDRSLTVVSGLDVAWSLVGDVATISSIFNASGPLTVGTAYEITFLAFG